MNLEELQNKRNAFLIRVYEEAMKECLASPTSVMWGLSDRATLIGGKLHPDEEHAGGYILGEEIGLKRNETRSIVIHLTNTGLLNSTLGASEFGLTMEGVRHAESLLKKSETDNQVPSYLNVTGNSGNIQIQMNSNHSVQQQTITIDTDQFNEFISSLKKDLEGLGDDYLELKEDIEDELNYATKQFIKQRDYKPQLYGIGKTIREIGIDVFTNLLSSGIYDIFKPLLGL